MHEFTQFLPGILLAYSAFLLGIASPGPNVLAVMGTSMSLGRSCGIALALGVAAGSFTWAVLAAVGLSALLANFAAALIVIKILGGLYLLWLAYKSLRCAARRYEVRPEALAGNDRGLLGFAIRGYTVQMTNPKAALAWIAITSLGLQEGAPLWVAFVIVAGTTLLSIVIHVLYAVGFSTAAMVRIYGRARRAIQATLGVFFAFAGFKLLLSRV
ncbi:MAG: LysE family translocator [Neomegalonema sp.]|nr:LysE family translocator [Neomegalonema sp.]